jgi:hypothetical protein
MDGFAYAIDLDRTHCFRNQASIRSGAYRAADSRGVYASASRINAFVILVQAHATEGQRGVKADPAEARPAPPTIHEKYDKLRQPCNCGEPVPGFHLVYCAWWRVYPEVGPFWPRTPNAYEQGLVAACTCGLGNDVNTGHPPTCAVWG